MLSKRLESAIEQREWEVVEICEGEIEELFDEFNCIINEVKKTTTLENQVRLNKLEDIFVQKVLVVKTAYRIGLKDGLEVEAIKNKTVSG